MTISRGQMKRQLRKGGGIMDVVPREKALLGGIKKAVKKVTKGVKSIAKSPIGKAAIAYGLTAGLGSLGAGAARSGTGFGIFSPGNVMKNLAATGSNILGSSIFTGRTNLNDYEPARNIFQKALGKITEGGITGNLAKGAGLLGLTTFLTSQFGMPQEQVESVLSDPAEKEKYLRLYYTNLNTQGDKTDEAYQAEVEEFVRNNLATGGRTGFEMGTPEQETSKRGEGIGSLMNKFMENQDEMVVIITMGEDGKPELIQVPKSEIMGDMGGSKEFPPVIVTGDSMTPRDNKAKGDSASMNAVQAASAEGLPLRQNPKGVMELDLRKEAGFIPPVGIKEKADDIPAMLSNNEFVFTADAVRGMGEGDVDLGAQRMYDMMKTLEAGGRV